MPGIEPVSFAIILVVILLSLAIHEFAHAKLADAAGDPTPRIYGRVTLNPLAHLDPAGTIMIVLSSISGFGIGWGKPVPMNSSRMGNPRWDHFVAVIGGPLSNLAQAAIYALVLRMNFASGSIIQSDVYDSLRGDSSHVGAFFLTQAIAINLGLCFFNLIPLGPLDGHWLVGTFLKDQTRLKWYMWNRTAGGLLLVMIVVMGQLNPEINVLARLLRPAVMGTFQFFTGVQLH